MQQEPASLQLLCLLVLTKDIQRDGGRGGGGAPRARRLHAERSELRVSDQTGFLGAPKPTLSRRHMRTS